MKEHPLILAAHLLPLWGVMSTLLITEGTLMLGSKWCTYCLFYSFIYTTEPLWLPASYDAGAKAVGRKAA